MTDETAETKTEETTTTTEPIKDERGGATPLQDWRDGITDKSLRDIAGRYTSPQALVEAHKSLQSKLNGAIYLPNDKSSDEDKAKFRKSLGVPDSVAGYTVTPPEGQKYDEGDLAVIESFAEVALEHNVPAPAFEKFMQMLSERATAIRQNTVEEIESARDEAEEALSQEWGNDFDKNVSLATRAAKAHGGDDFIKFLNGTKVEGFGLLGDHPAMVKFLAKIGAKSDEHDMVLQSSAAEKKSAADEIEEIIAKNPIGTAGYNSQKVQRRLGELYAKVTGDQPIAGGMRRTG